MLKALRRRLPRVPRNWNGRTGTRSTQAGQSIILLALSMLALLAMLSLAVDTGNLYLQRRRAQQAADMAALAGATNWTGVIPDVKVKKPDAFRDARRVAIANGFDTNPGAEHGENGEVTVLSPPETALNNHNDEDYVEVKIERTVPSLFGRVLGFENFRIAGRAVARVKHLAFDAATISLSEDPASTKFMGNSVVQVVGNVYSRGGLSNQSAATQVWVKGDVFVRTTISSGTEIVTEGGEIVTGSDQVPYLADPGYRPPPKPSTVINTWRNNFSPPLGQEWVYITPGQYNSIDILSSGTKTVFCSGVYWIKGSVKFSGTAKSLDPAKGEAPEAGVSNCNAGPVIFVLDGPNVRFETVAGSTVTFHSAPYSNGIYFNSIVIYSATYVDGSTNPPTLLSTGSCGNPVKVVGGSNVVLNGAIYVPCGDAQIAGTAGGTVHGQVIANTVTFDGTAGPSVVYNADLAPETPGPTLVE